MTHSFNWTLSDGRQGRLVASYSCDMQMLSQMIDGATTFAGYLPVAEHSRMTAYLDGEDFDYCFDPDQWCLVDFEETPKSGARKIAGMAIGFLPETAALYEAWLAELLDAGDSPAVKAYRKEQEEVSHGE